MLILYYYVFQRNVTTTERAINSQRATSHDVPDLVHSAFPGALQTDDYTHATRQRLLGLCDNELHLRGVRHLLEKTLLLPPELTHLQWRREQEQHGRNSVHRKISPAVNGGQPIPDGQFLQ